MDNIRINNQFEARVLTLKKWAVPHNKPLKELFIEGKKADSRIKYEDYLAFQDYHFVDISDPIIIEEGEQSQDLLFDKAYSTLKKNRSRILETELPGKNDELLPGYDVSIRQSLILLGKKSSFWGGESDKKPPLLYISLIQLKNPFPDRLNEVEDQLLKAFDQTNQRTGEMDNTPREDNVAVYFSLDYCDAVIFTKNMPSAHLHDKLWNLLFGQPGLAKYTVTIFGYEYDYLRNLLEGKSEESGDELVERAADLIPSKQVALAVDLTVHDRLKLDSLIWDLQNGGSDIARRITVEPYQITGRYDLRLMVKVPNSEGLLTVIQKLDEYGRLDERENFISSQVVPLTIYYPSNKNKSVDSACLPQFNNPMVSSEGKDISRAIDELLKRCINRFVSDWRQDTLKQTSEGENRIVSSSQAVRITEVFQSIRALHKNGLSQEFILSFLPSLYCFMTICHEYMTCGDLMQHKDRYDLRRVPKENLSRFQDDYFNCLNMLIQSTMHSERQFIQAPAVNMTLFDVPPKLIVFYTAIADVIAEELNDEDRVFSFFFFFYFRDDIHVRPISPRYPILSISEKTYSIFCINLDERSFYRPSYVIELLCHEVAHYVGDETRNRTGRAKGIFNCVGGWIFVRTLPFVMLREIKGVIVNAISGYLLQEYEQYLKKKSDSEGNTNYFADDVRKFLERMVSKADAFTGREFISNLTEKLKDSLNHLSIEDVCRLMNPSRGSCEESSKKEINTVYLMAKAANGAEETMHPAVIEALASEIALRIATEWSNLLRYDDLEDTENLFQFCQEVVICFREAYADYRMIELLQLEPQEYQCMVEEYQSNETTSDLQKYIRERSVKSACWNMVSMKEEPRCYRRVGMRELLTDTCENIKNYLHECCNKNIYDSQLHCCWENISKTDTFTQLETMYEVTRMYQKRVAEIDHRLDAEITR